MSEFRKWLQRQDEAMIKANWVVDLERAFNAGMMSQNEVNSALLEKIVELKLEIEKLRNRS